VVTATEPYQMSLAQTVALHRRAEQAGMLPEDMLNEFLYSTPARRGWSAQEDAYILNPANSPRSLAAMLPGRTAHAISVRRSRLRAAPPAPSAPTPTAPAAPLPPPPPAEPPPIHLQSEPCPYCLPTKPSPTCRICLGTGSIDTMPES
jgi:hypothetical protein